jgi:phosphatidylinositol alpha-1,6-mannosyltransferase
MTPTDSAAENQRSSAGPGTPRRIVGLFPELLGIGGVQEAGRLTAAALDAIADRRRWSLDLLSLNDPPGAQSLEIAGRKIAFLGFGRAKLRFVFAGIICARRAARTHAPLALGAHPNLAFPLAWMQRAAPGLQTIVMSHGIEVWKPLSTLRRGALVKATSVLAPSSDTARKLADVQGVPAAKTSVLPWPLNPAFVCLADRAAEIPPPPDFPAAPVILTVGRWMASERYKGLDELLHAVALLRAGVPALHLVVIGGGDDLPRLRKLSGDLGVSANVLFLEKLSRDHLAACYAHADIFALPSAGEGFGIVFLEAMVFAKPAVAAASGGATDVVEEGINGLLIPPRDPGRLAEALKRLLDDESLRRTLGRRGAAIVREKYSFDTFQARLEQILG